MSDLFPEQRRRFEITLAVKPVGKARARVTRNGHAYTPQPTVNAEAEIRWLLQKAAPPCFPGPVLFVCRILLKRPKSVPKRRTHPTVKPDLSNILKLVEDAANGILYNDDAQICSVLLSKEYAETEGIVLAVQEL